MKKLGSQTISVKYKVILFALVLGLIISTSLLCFVGFKADADVELSKTEIKAEYARGTTIDIPNADISVDGNVIANVQPLIYLPSGRLTAQTTLDLNEIGRYTLEYSAETDGKRYTKTQNFNVYDYLFVNSSTGEPLVYGEHAFKNEKNDRLLKGLKFNLKQGEEIKYNKILDLSRSTKNDLLLSIEATPRTPEVVEFKDLYIKLTDVYDDTNFLTIRVRKGPAEDGLDASYVGGSFGTEQISGVHADKSRDKWGIGIKNGLAGAIDGNHTTIDIYFDYDSKCLYTMDKLNGQKALVVDYLNDYQSPWQGFTTGEVFMSIYADSFTSVAVNQPAVGMILDVYNEDISSNLAEDGTVSLYKITNLNPPQIDFGSYLTKNDIPNAMVGFPYKIFPSVQNSIYVTTPTDIKVYYGYYSSSRFAIPVQDGAFVPVTDGVYTIIYRSVDVFGNTGEAFVDVFAQKKTSDTFTLDIQEVDNEYKTAVVGTERDIPQTFKTSGNLGVITVTAKATHTDGTVIDIEGYSFVPTKGGKWTVTYTAVDAVTRTGIYSYDIDATVSDKVIFGKVQYMSDYFIVNAKNPIPMLQCADYNADGIYKDVDKIIVEKEGANVGEITDGYFVPESAGTYTVKYQATSSKGVVADTGNLYTFTAIDVGFGKAEFSLSKYFHSKTGGITATSATNSEVVISVKGNESFEFIKPVDAINFALKFNVKAGADKVNAVKISLEDVYDAGQKVEIVFAKSSGKVALTVNSKTTVIEGYTFGGDANFALSIKSGRLTLDKTVMDILTFANGNAYSGFTSGLVKLSFKVLTENGNADVVDFIVSEITGQAFTNDDADYIAPRIIVGESVNATYFIGEEIKILSAKVVDVIDTYATATLSVIAPSNAFVKDVNGVELKNVPIDKDYVIKTAEYGKYKIRYEMSDSSNLSASTVAFEVLSRAKPVITLEKTSIEIDAGDTVDVPEITVESVSSTLKVYIYVRGPIGNLKEIETDETGNYVEQLTFKETGKYIIRYLVIDEWNNISFADYTVNVK